MTPNPIMEFVVEWGVLLVSILLVFSPFIYLGIRKWRKHLSVTFMQVIGAYLISFFLYVSEWIVLNKLDVWSYSNFPNAQWIRDAIFSPFFRTIFITGLAWPALVFYCSVLIKKRPYNVWHFVVSLFISILMLYFLFKLTLFLMAV